MTPSQFKSQARKLAIVLFLTLDITLIAVVIKQIIFTKCS
jgi:hypothetical protein